MTDLRVVARSILDESSWADGAARDRALVAVFALLPPHELDRSLRTAILSVLRQLDDSNRDFGRVRQALEPEPGYVLVDEGSWDFPGGDELSDAVMAAEASFRLRRDTVKSVGHALAAVEAVVAAIVEHRHHQRDPADWTLFHEQWTQDLGSPASRSKRAEGP